jgi:hypothetical protein
MVKHAVVTNEQIIMISSQERKLVRQPLPLPVTHIVDLWQVGHDIGITHFWIMPDTDIERSGSAFLTARDGYKIFIPGQDELDTENAPKAATCKKGYVKGTFEIEVNYPAHAGGFNWNVKTPLDILAAVDYLSTVLETPAITFSPQHIGKDLLKRQYSKTKRLQSYIAPCTVDLQKLPFRKAAPEIFFLHPLTHEQIGQWFHLYDKNSAHPSAAASMTTGTNEPIHVPPEHAASIAEPKKPGVYRVTFSPDDSPFNGVTLPLIIESEWVTLDVLKFARKQGYSVEVQEGYIFEHGYNLFGVKQGDEGWSKEGWARSLWQARQSLKDTTKFPHPGGRDNAEYTAKHILNFSISAMKQNINWWADMVGLARAARLANLKKWVDDSGVYPFYVYADDMSFVTPEPEPEHAIPGILARKTELGGYKHKFSLQITQEMIDDCTPFTSLKAQKAAQKTHEYLKKIARERGLLDG